MSIEAFIRDYVFKELGASAVLGLEDELNIDTFGAIPPLTIAPMVSPFGRRRQERDFPIYSKELFLTIKNLTVLMILMMLT